MTARKNDVSIHKIDIEIGDDEYKLLSQIANKYGMPIESVVSVYIRDMLAIETKGENLSFAKYHDVIESMALRLEENRTWLIPASLAREANVTFPQFNADDDVWTININ